MKNASARSNPMIMVGLIVAMVLLIGAIVISSTRPANNEKVVHLAAGEWAPYIGESLPENGVAAAIVDFIFKQMGYKTEYQFMPWALVHNRAEQSQTNSQIRGVFPYIYSQQRESQFYFSDGIIDIPYGVFYHRAHNPDAQNISGHQDLNRFSIITLQGYEYDHEIRQYLPLTSCEQKDTMQGLQALEQNLISVIISHQPLSNESIARALSGEQANRIGINVHPDNLHSFTINTSQDFGKLSSTSIQTLFVYAFDLSVKATDFYSNINDYQLILPAQTTALLDFQQVNHSCIQPDEMAAILYLAYLSKPKVMIEAIEVGESILSLSLPELAPFIQLSAYSKAVPHRIMFPKNNPNNLALRDLFNQRLNELRSNQQAYDKLVTSAINKIQLASAVSLVASAGNKLVSAGVFDVHSQQCLFESPVFFPNGSKALVRQWPSVFLNTSRDDSLPYVLARILNGPLAGSANLYCFAAESVKL